MVIWHVLWCFKTAVCCDHLKSTFDCCFMFLFRPYCMLCRWCIPVSHCLCVRSLFPLLLHPRPSSLPSTCRRSILTRWSSTSLWVHIPLHLIPSSSPHSPPPPLLRSLAVSVPPHNPRKYKIVVVCCSSRQTVLTDWQELERVDMSDRRWEGHKVKNLNQSR